MSTLILMKDAHLLSRSEITKDYKELSSLVTLYPEGVMDTHVPSGHPFWQLYKNGTYLMIRDTARKEWVLNASQTREIIGGKENWERCDICRSRIKLVFGIRNTRNNATMKIGRECLRHFQITKTEDGRTAEEVLRELLVVRKYGRLAEETGDIDAMRSDWPRYLSRQPILVPDPMAGDYERIADRFEQLVEKFLDPKRDKIATRLITEIKEVIEEREQLVEQIDTYVKANQHDPMAITRRLYQETKDRLRSDKFAEFEKVCLETGKLQWRTALSIHDPLLIEKLLVPVGAQMKDLMGIHQVHYKAADHSVEFKCPSVSRLPLQTKYPEFFMEYGGPAFGESLDDQDAKALIDAAVIRHRDSIEEAMDRLHNITQRSGYRVPGVPSLKLDSTVFHEENDYFVQEVATKDYLQVPLRPTLDRFKSLFLNPEKGNVTDYLEYVQAVGKRHSASDFMTFAEGRVRGQVGR